MVSWLMQNVSHRRGRRCGVPRPARHPAGPWQRRMAPILKLSSGPLVGVGHLEELDHLTVARVRGGDGLPEADHLRPHHRTDRHAVA
jgi:hypothetical protein